MTDILSPRGRDDLRAFLARSPLLAFDFDGTLSGIVSKPGTAVLRPAVASRLRRLARQRPCALITGRSLVDIGPRVAGIRWEAVVGNHGMETRPPLPHVASLRRRARRWLPELEWLAARYPGVELEDKGFSYSVHFRHAPRRFATGRLLAVALRRHARGWDARLVPGKFVFNILPRGAANKGEALRRLCESSGASCAFYVGDDVTDEDAFAALPASRSFGVVVGKRPSRARYYLRRQSDMVRLLSLILAEEGPSSLP